MVASEAAPFVKTGGLADVLGSLPAALAKRGDEVAVVLPRYRSAVIETFERIWDEMSLSVGPRRFTVAIDQVIRQGVRYLFVDCPPLYDRPGIYNEHNIDYPDNHIRFALLNQAAIGIARNIFRPPGLPRTRLASQPPCPLSARDLLRRPDLFRFQVHPDHP